MSIGDCKALLVRLDRHDVYMNKNGEVYTMFTSSMVIKRVITSQMVAFEGYYRCILINRRALAL